MVKKAMLKSLGARRVATVMGSTHRTKVVEIMINVIVTSRSRKNKRMKVMSNKKVAIFIVDHAISVVRKGTRLRI